MLIWSMNPQIPLIRNLIDDSYKSRDNFEKLYNIMIDQNNFLLKKFESKIYDKKEL